MESFLNALAHDRFRSLTNNFNGWTIAFVSQDNQSIREISDSHFDKLIERWESLLQDIEAQQDDGARIHIKAGVLTVEMPKKCDECGGAGVVDSGGTNERGDFINVPCGCIN